MAITTARDVEKLEAQLRKLRRQAIRADHAQRVARLERQIELAKRLRARELERTEDRLASLTSSFNRSAERIRARALRDAERRKARRDRATEARTARAKRLREQIANGG